MSEPKRLSQLRVVAGLLILGALVLGICVPNYVGSPRSKTVAIINNLRRLDGAMQMWAFEHGKTGAVVVTAQDVAPYLRDSVKPIAGERYVLKTLSQPPEAQLTYRLEGRPKGSVLRLSTNGTFNVILPN
jgi:hypothetical protein